MAAARLLQRALLAEVKGEMKAKRGQLLDTMRSMPDYSLQVRRCQGWSSLVRLSGALAGAFACVELVHNLPDSWPPLRG
jgi:hypothetical protein